ncbi:nucleoside diphosphate kinase, partial [Toxoplasma gondii RUB]
VCVVDGSLSPEAIFQQVKHLFLPVVTYLLAAPGLPICEAAKNLQGERAQHVDLQSLLRDRARADTSLTHMLASGTAPPASVVCPLLVEKLKTLQNQGECFTVGSSTRKTCVERADSTLPPGGISDLYTPGDWIPAGEVVLPLGERSTFP